MKNNLKHAKITKRDIKDKRERLKNIIARLTNEKELDDTVVPNMSLFCITKPNRPACLVYEPCLCMAAQGAKLVTLAGESYVYDENRYLIASVNLPTMAQVIHASEKSPLLRIQAETRPRGNCAGNARERRRRREARPAGKGHRAGRRRRPAS